MFATERRRIIKEYLIENTKVSVVKLSTLFGVSEVTVRKDLELLENEGFLERIHGGAILREDENNIIPAVTSVSDKKTLQEQIYIADLAYDFISDGETIMLTDGTTNRQIAKKMSTRNNLTILTNDILVALEFSKSVTNKLILLGGTLSENALYGQLTQNNLESFHINHVFIEVDAISLENGISVSSIDKASFIQQVFSRTESKTIVCLPDNFGEASLFKVCDLDFPDKILTSHKLNDKFKKQIFEQDVQLFTSLNLYEE